MSSEMSVEGNTKKKTEKKQKKNVLLHEYSYTRTV